MTATPDQIFMKDWKNAIKSAETSFGVDFTAERRRWNDCKTILRAGGFIKHGVTSPSSQLAEFKRKLVQLTRLKDAIGAHGPPMMMGGGLVGESRKDFNDLCISLIGHAPSPFHVV